MNKHLPESKTILKGKELLVLEDDVFLSKRIEAKFEEYETEVTKCDSLAQARNALKSLSFDFALLDLNLPDGESLELLREALIPENTLVILMTAQDGIQSVVEAIRLGAVDYLNKPFDLEEIPFLFLKSEKQRKSERLIQHGTEQRKQKSSNLFFNGSFAEDLRQLKRIIEVDQRLLSNLPPVLIDGPTGSGKSTYAKWIHDNGPRQEAPFVAINCSAIPDNLVESELFGHEKGAFTDAKGARIGLFEAADRGTLFLDEISSLSHDAQSKLLLTIENGLIRRIGGNNEIKVDVRIIGAANQDLRRLIAEGSFREDLFHRLDLLRVNIPPLESRGNDVVDLANHLLLSLARKYNVEKPSIDPDSIPSLTSYPWPGNTRELIHELERALVMGEPNQSLKLDFHHTTQKIPANTDWLNQSFLFPDSGFDLENEILRLIELAIKQCDGNVSEAARKLGVPRDYIRYRKKKKVD